MIISVVCMPHSGLKQSSVLISAGTWNQESGPRFAWHTRTRNRRQKTGVDLWRQFL